MVKKVRPFIINRRQCCSPNRHDETAVACPQFTAHLLPIGSLTQALWAALSHALTSPESLQDVNNTIQRTREMLQLLNCRRRDCVFDIYTYCCDTRLVGR